jgi:hypothetical protein
MMMIILGFDELVCADTATDVKANSINAIVV